MLVLVDDAALRGRQDCVLHLRLTCQVFVEVGEVLLNARHVWWRKLLLRQGIDVEVREPGVRQDFLDTVGSEALRAVLVEQLHNEVLRLGRDRDSVAHWVWEAHWTLPDQEVHSVLVPVEERRNSDNHFEDEDAQGPPIHCKVVPITDEHLRCQVLGRTTERVGQLASLHELGQTKVSHEQVA